MQSRWEKFDPATAWQAWSPDAECPWDFAAAAHLNRRVAFAAPWKQIEQDAKTTPQATIARLFDFSGDGSAESDRDRMAEVIAAGNDVRNLAAAWILRMAQTDRPALERATLFWHGHFATSAAKVAESRLMLGQNRLLREHALGKLEPMVLGIARDPAMLVYLDSRESRKANPNENFARELMELFCLGTGNYSESDIREMAKCFTGYEIRYGKFRFNKYQYNDGVKTFLGQSGNFDGNDAVRIVLAQPACAGFLVCKLIRYYVADDFPNNTKLLEPLADEYRNSGFDTGSLIQKIVASRVFFSPECRGSRISSPVEMAVGVLRGLQMEANMQTFAESLGELGQLPYFPPSVKGWDGGTTWINAQTLIGRANLVEKLLRENGDTAEPDFPGWSSSNREMLVENLCQLFLTQPLPENLRSQFRSVLKDTRVPPRRILAEAMAVLASLPEFHLS